MNVCSSFWRSWLILQVLVLTAVTQDSDSLELDRNVPPLPFSLPVSYNVQGADYLLLREMGQELLRNTSTCSHSQALLILQTGQPAAVNASYGPLWAQQKVPAEQLQSAGSFTTVRAFALSRYVFSSMPNVRVLFYDPKRGRKEGALPCVTLFGFYQTQEVRGRCMLPAGTGMCLAELVLPAGWFSQAPGSAPSQLDRMRQEGNAVELYFQAWPRLCGRCSEEAPVAPMQPIGTVWLSEVRSSTNSLSQLKLGDDVVIKAFSKPLRRTDIASFYVFLSSGAIYDKFILRAIVKKGVSFCTATPSNILLWDTVVHTGADGIISIMCQKKTFDGGKRLDNSPLEILRLEFEAEDLSGESESRVIKWQLEVPGDPQVGGEGFMWIRTMQRDLLGLVPLVTDTEILNTAVLNGKWVSVPVRTVAVEADGSITDISNHTDCRSTDEDVLKVAERCDYVYVNGKETRGKMKMAVNFTYSYLSAQLEMNVWIPRLPLQIELSDSELSQIKSWRVPITASRRQSLESEEERRGKGCTLQFQHALLRVLTQFVSERPNPEDPPAIFLGPDWQVDVTLLVRRLLKVEDQHVAQLLGERVLSGRDVGTTVVKVVSPLSNAILAEKTVTVKDDKVIITELGVQLVSNLLLSLQLSPSSNRAIVATTTMQDTLQSRKQEAIISSWIKFSDGSSTPLEIYDPSHYTQYVTSLDEGVVSVRKAPLAVVAEEEGQGALVKVELTIGGDCQKSKRRNMLAVGSGSLTVKFHSSSLAASGGAIRMDGSSGCEELLENITLKVTATAASTMLGGATPSTRIFHFVHKKKDNKANPSERKKDHGSLVAYTNFPSQMEIPKWNDEEEKEVSRPFTDLEMGMYALLGVFCLAVLIFFTNCISYMIKLHRKQDLAHVSEHPAHQHDWVWLGSDTELAMNLPGTPAQQSSHPATVIDIGAPANGGSNSKPEPTHSPTSKRKRVRFATFITVERHRASYPSGQESINGSSSEPEALNPEPLECL